MSDWKSESNVVKLRLDLDKDAAIEFAHNLKIMNLSFAALVPGLEGFARSINQRNRFHYRELAENQTRAICLDRDKRFQSPAHAGAQNETRPFF